MAIQFNFDAQKKKISEIFASRPDLEKLSLAEMQEQAVKDFNGFNARITELKSFASTLENMQIELESMKLLINQKLDLAPTALQFAIPNDGDIIEYNCQNDNSLSFNIGHKIVDSKTLNVEALRVACNVDTSGVVNNFPDLFSDAFVRIKGSQDSVIKKVLDLQKDNKLPLSVCIDNKDVPIIKVDTSEVLYFC